MVVVVAIVGVVVVVVVVPAAASIEMTPIIKHLSCSSRSSYRRCHSGDRHLPTAVAAAGERGNKTAIREATAGGSKGIVKRN